MNYSTRMEWVTDHWDVLLSNADTVVARMSLDEWKKLSATEFLITETAAGSADPADVYPAEQQREAVNHPMP